MANVVYNTVFGRAATTGLTHTTGVFRMLALTAASDINPDDDTVTAVLARAGTTEVNSATVTSYARSLLAYTDTTNQAGSVTTDDTNNRAVWEFDNLTFNLATGGPVSTAGVLVFLDVAGDNSNDGTAIPLYYWDAAFTDITELAVNGGANGQIHFQQG